MNNEYEIRIRGGISIPEQLDSKKSVMVGVEADIYEISKRDKQDGDALIIYKAMAVGFPIISQGEKKYKAQIKNKKSQLWRWKVNEWGEDYDTFMNKMLDHSEEVIEFIRNL